MTIDPMDNHDLSTLTMSWQTRMASVMRQFDKLTRKPAFDKTNEQMVNFIGMSLVRGTPSIQVIPTDGGAIYPLRIEELDV
jgi:hypothetical protein